MSRAYHLARIIDGFTDPPPETWPAGQFLIVRQPGAWPYHLVFLTPDNEPRMFGDWDIQRAFGFSLEPGQWKLVNVEGS